MDIVVAAKTYQYLLGRKKHPKPSSPRSEGDSIADEGSSLSELNVKDNKSRSGSVLVSSVCQTDNNSTVGDNYSDQIIRLEHHHYGDGEYADTLTEGSGGLFGAESSTTRQCVEVVCKNCGVPMKISILSEGTFRLEQYPQQYVDLDANNEADGSNNNVDRGSLLLNLDMEDEGDGSVSPFTDSAGYKTPEVNMETFPGHICHSPRSTSLQSSRSASPVQEGDMLGMHPRDGIADDGFVGKEDEFRDSIEEYVTDLIEQILAELTNDYYVSDSDSDDLLAPDVEQESESGLISAGNQDLNIQEVEEDEITVIKVVKDKSYLDQVDQFLHTDGASVNHSSFDPFAPTAVQTGTDNENQLSHGDNEDSSTNDDGDNLIDITNGDNLIDITNGDNLIDITSGDNLLDVSVEPEMKGVHEEIINKVQNQPVVFDVDVAFDRLQQMTPGNHTVETKSLDIFNSNASDNEGKVASHDEDSLLDKDFSVDYWIHSTIQDPGDEHHESGYMTLVNQDVDLDLDSGKDAQDGNLVIIQQGEGHDLNLVDQSETSTEKYLGSETESQLDRTEDSEMLGEQQTRSESWIVVEKSHTDEEQTGNVGDVEVIVYDNNEEVGPSEQQDCDVFINDDSAQSVHNTTTNADVNQRIDPSEVKVIVSDDTTTYRSQFDMLVPAANQKNYKSQFVVMVPGKEPSSRGILANLNKMKSKSLSVLPSHYDGSLVTYEGQGVMTAPEKRLHSQRSIEVRQIGVSPSLDESIGQVEIELKYNEAKEQIQKLELQLAGRSKKAGPTSKEWTRLEGENKSLKDKINDLQRKLDEKNIMLKSQEQEKSLAKERNSYLQQEINRLREEWLSLKEGISSEHQNTSRYIDQIDALQRELSKYRKESNDLREILIGEQEKFRLGDIEKEETVDEIERLAEQNGQLAAEQRALEERNIALQEQLSRMKEEMNQMVVDKSHLQADYEELKADRDRYRDGLVSRDDLNSQLKELLQDNQGAAEQLRRDLQRLNGEVEEKNNNITRLRSKLTRVQQKYQIPSTDLTSEPGDLDTMETTPRRSRAGSGVESVTAVFGSSNGNHKAEFHTILNDGRGGSSSGVGTPQRRISTAERSSVGSPLDGSNDRTITEGDRSHREEMYLKQVHVLQGQLKAVQDLNDALKKELSLNDSLNRSHSIGVQNSPAMGSLSTQAGAAGELSLREHLEEIRALRRRLEQSIEQNDRLRELLERQLRDMGVDQDTVNQYMSAGVTGHTPPSKDRGHTPPSRDIHSSLDEMTRELELLQQEIQAKNREIEILTSELQGLRRDMVNKDKIFLELEQRLRTKDETLQMITMDADQKAGQLRTAKHDIKRLKDEINVLRAGAEEQEELNKTLKLELSVYDKMNNAEDSQSAGTVESEGIDLNLLLQELRQLRIQLEKSIENNNLLRQKLEEQLSRGVGSPRSTISHHSNTVNQETHVDDEFEELEKENEIKSRGRYNRHGFGVRFSSDTEKYGSTGGGTMDSGLGGSQEYNDPLYGMMGETYLDRYFARKGLITSNGAGGASRTRSLGRSPADRSPAASRSRTPINGTPASPPTKLERSSSLGRDSMSPRRDATSPRRDLMSPRQHSRHSSRPSSRGPQADDTAGSLYPHELTNGSSPEFPRDAYHGSEDPLHSILNLTGSSIHRGEPDSVVNGYGSADGAMRYSIYDPARPPILSSTSIESDIEYLRKGSTTQRVGADLRQLYAIGELDDYELLKKEIGESHAILNGMETRIRDKLRKYKHTTQGEKIKSKEYQLMRDIISSIHQAKTLNAEANRLVSLFWTSQLPLRDQHGNFVDVKMLKQNQSLQDELHKYKRECTRLKGQLSDANIRMQIASKSRDGMERELLNSLTNHHHTLRKANGNLESYGVDGRQPMAYR